MVKCGDLVRVARGKYGPPGSSSKYTPIAHQIIATLIDAGEMTVTALQKSTGLPNRNSIASAIYDLRKRGLLVTADQARGLARLSPEALAKIKGGQPILDGLGTIIWAPGAEDF